MDHGVAVVSSNRKQKQGLRRKIFFFLICEYISIKVLPNDSFWGGGETCEACTHITEQKMEAK